MRSKIRSYFLRLGKNNLILTDLVRCKGEEIDKINEFEFASAGMLSIDENDEVDHTIKAEINHQVKLFIQNKYYTVRLLSSALVFLALYLFCSLVIRDPIPMLDELAIATAGAIGLWLYMNKREGNGAYAVKIRLDLEELYHNKSNLQLEFLEKLEAYLYDLNSRYDSLTLCDILAKNEKEVLLPELKIETSSEAESFKVLLADYLKHHSSLSSLYKRIKANDRADKQLAATLINAEMRGENLLLLALCVVLL